MVEEYKYKKWWDDMYIPRKNTENVQKVAVFFIIDKLHLFSYGIKQSVILSSHFFDNA